MSVPLLYLQKECTCAIEKNPDPKGPVSKEKFRNKYTVKCEAFGPCHLYIWTLCDYYKLINRTTNYIV